MMLAALARARALRLALVLAVLLAACIPPPAHDATPVAPGATSTAAAPQAGATIARIRARGLLRVGVRFDRDPFGFVTGEGDLAGFDIDLAREFARRWLGDPGKVDFYQITPHTAASKLGGDGVDLLLGALPRERALETVADFTQPYYTGGPAFLLRRTSTLATFGDLADRTVAVGEGESVAQLISDTAKSDGITVTVRSFMTHTVALGALRSGAVFAVAGDSVQLAADARANAETFALAPVRFWPSYAAPVVAQGDTTFRTVVDFTLQDMKADGTFDQLYARWFPGDVAPPLDAWPGRAPFDFANAPDRPPATASAIDRLRAGQPPRVGVLVDRPGWSVISGTAAGFAVDLANEFARRWISPTAQAEFIAVTTESGLQALADGRIDLLAAPLTQQADYLDRADVSIPYFQDGQVTMILVRREYTGLESLSDLTIGAAGQPAGDRMQQALAARAISSTVVVYPDMPAVLAAWDADEVNVVTGDLTELGAYNNAHPEITLVGPQLSIGTPLVLGVPSGDGRLRDLVNFTLQAMAEDGGYAELYQRWYGEAPPFRIPVWPGTPGDLGVNIHKR
jgi:putative glutamine transport system substrate-binding protein